MGAFLQSFLGEQTLVQFSVQLTWGLIGLIGSILIQILKSKSKIKQNGGFRLGHWLDDNLIRLLISFLIIFVGSVRGDLVVNQFGEYGCMGLGFMTDKAIEALLKLDFSFLKTKE